MIVENTRIEQGDRTIQYDSIWVSSFTDAAVKGLPDAELRGPEARSVSLDEIVNVTHMPIIVDGDTGVSRFNTLCYPTSRISNDNLES